MQISHGHTHTLTRPATYWFQGRFSRIVLKLAGYLIWGSLSKRLNQVLSPGPKPSSTNMLAAIPLRFTHDQSRLLAGAHFFYLARSSTKNIPFVTECNETFRAVVVLQKHLTLY